MLLPGQIKPLVQTEINEKGEFKFELDSLQTCFYRLKIDERNTIYLRLNPNDEIEINASYPNIQANYSIDGSEESKNLKELNMYLMKSTKRLNEINDQIVAAYKIPNYDVDSLIEVLNVEARAMYKNDKEFLINFIKKHNESVIIYFALYQYVSIFYSLSSHSCRRFSPLFCRYTHFFHLLCQTTGFAGWSGRSQKKLII